MKIFNYLRISEKAEIKERKEKELNFKKNSYLSLQKKRLKFRQNLVRTIMGQRVNSQNEKWFTEDDMDLLRYYYYIMNGIDNEHVPPIEDNILNNILKLVPLKWQKKFKDTMSEVVKEVIDDYILSVKKSVVDFVLQDPLIDESNTVDQVLKLNIYRRIFKYKNYIFLEPNF